MKKKHRTQKLNKKEIKDFFKTNKFKTLIVSLKKKANIYIYKNVELQISKSSKIKVKEKLGIGRIVGYTGRLKTTFILEKNAKVDVQGKFYIYTGSKVVVREGASLILGNGSFINVDSKIYCKEKVEIGNNTFIGEEVIIRDTDEHSISNVNTKPIKIGNHVWIGMKALILKGVTIGDNSVIAAGSVVNKDVPSNCLVAGNPAKVIRTNVNWE